MPKKLKKTPLTFSEQLIQVKDVEGLRSVLGIADPWHYIIVGDGSAQTWEHFAGWASILIDSGDLIPQVFTGAMSAGTNIMCEMLAFIHPLWKLASIKRVEQAEVHIVTDCQPVQNSGNGKVERKKNREMWFMVDAFRRKGLNLHFHYIPRDTLSLNKLAHDLANAARKTHEYAMPKLLKSSLAIQEATTVADLCPND